MSSRTVLPGQDSEPPRVSWNYIHIILMIMPDMCISFPVVSLAENYDWIGYWGKHMKAQGFKTIREYQKVSMASWVL